MGNCKTPTKEAGNDKTSTLRPKGERPVIDNESPGSGAAPGTVLDRVKDQFGVRGMIKEYMIPVETNIVSYILGGVLAISLVLEIATGMLLAMRYLPDAGRAYGITNTLLHEGGWSVVLNFHYWNAYLIFALIMIHMMRTFFSGGYRGSKKGLWQVGVGLAGVTFLISITGETLHWDERGFAVPWHMSEILEAVGLDKVFNYTHADLKVIPKATDLLVPYYALHVAILPVVLLALIAVHYYLIKVKGISLPFWHKPSGRTSSFGSHIKAWFGYGAIILGVVLVISFFHRDAGPQPQLLPTSEYFGSKHGPGTLGITPTFPIGWTHGMNRFVDIAFGLAPDIWGTVIGLALMTAALVAVPYLDRGGPSEPRSWAEALDWHRRGWAFTAIAVFWVVMIIGTLTNIITPVG
jgi:quinol-cytochrome oxidoreductase complex cytochrome b subunit